MTPDEIRDLLAGAAGGYRNVRATIVYTLRRPGSRRVVRERRVAYERPDRAFHEEWRLSPTVHRLVGRAGRHGERWWQQTIGRREVIVHRGGSGPIAWWPSDPEAPPSQRLPMRRIAHVGIVHPAVLELLDPSEVVGIGNVDITLEDRGETSWLERPARRITVSCEPNDVLETVPWGDAELLVDVERGVILRAEDSGRGGATLTSEMTEIAFDLDLPPATFEPPEGSELFEVDDGEDDEPRVP